MLSRSVFRRGLSTTAAAVAPKIENPRIVLAESFAKLHAVRAAKDSASVAAAAKNSIKIDAKVSSFLKIRNVGIMKERSQGE